MNGYVIDASVAVKWLVDEVYSKEADALLTSGSMFIAPSLVFAESVNALWAMHQRGDISDHDLSDAVDTLLSTLSVFADMLPGMELNTRRVESLASESYMLATDLADYLVGKGVPFRDAHGVMRRLCQHCEADGLSLYDLPIAEYRRFAPQFDEDVYAITARASVAARDNPGGTAPNRVAEGLARANMILAAGTP